MVTREDVVAGLKEVIDPEIHLDIYTLELIREINIKNSSVQVIMTFTTPMCPYGPMLVESIKTRLHEIQGIEDVDVKVELNPPWEPSEELRALLGV